MAYPFYPQQNFYPTYPQTYQQTYQPQSGIMWVDSYEDALKFPLAPNNAVRLWHRTQPVVYFKESDPSGRVSIKAYDLIERAEKPSESIPGENVKLPDYATKDELSGILAEISGIKTDIETIKGDMYGIAGKKKVKKDDE